MNFKWLRGLIAAPNIARMGFTLVGREAADPDEVAQQGLDYLGREPIGTIGRLDRALAAAARASLGSR